MRFLGLLLIAVMGLTAAASGTAAQDGTTVAGDVASVARTNIRYFLPYSEAGLAAGLTVTDSVSGHCMMSSLANLGRPDAWICTDSSTNELYDPCFENPFGPLDVPEEVVCATSPFSTELVSLTLTEPLQRFKDIEAEDMASADVADPGEPVSESGDGDDLILAAQDEPGDSAEAAISPLDIPWGLELANGKRCTLLTGATAVLAGERINYACEDGGVVLGEVNRGELVWTVSYLADGAFATDLVAVAVAWT